MTNQTELARVLLQKDVERSVAERLSELTRKFAELMKDFPPEDKYASEMIVLELIEAGALAFTSKKRGRITTKVVPPPTK